MSDSQRVSLLQLPCRQASHLLSEALDRPLTRRECWALRIHTCLCSACRRFSKQLVLLRQTLSLVPEVWRDRWQSHSAGLSVKRREAIKRLLAEAGRADSQN